MKEGCPARKKIEFSFFLVSIKYLAPFLWKNIYRFDIFKN